MKAKLGYMAKDNFGNTWHGLKHPRKELLEELGYKRASKMYVDTKAGEVKHVGYVIGPHWINVYEVWSIA